MVYTPKRECDSTLRILNPNPVCGDWEATECLDHFAEVWRLLTRWRRMLLHASLIPLWCSPERRKKSAKKACSKVSTLALLWAIEIPISRKIDFNISIQLGFLVAQMVKSSVQLLSPVWLFATLWTASRQASLSITNSQSLLKLMSIESVMPSNHFILSSPSPPAFNLSQHQGLFKSVSASHQVAKVLELQLQHQTFQWIFRTDFL